MAVTIRAGSKTGTKESSYANVKAEIQKYQASKSQNTAKTSGGGSSGTIKAAAPQPITTTNNTEKSPISPSNLGKTEESYWKTDGWQRVGAVLNPFNWDKVYITNPFTGIIQADATIPVKGAVIAGETALTVAGGAAALNAIRGTAAASSIGAATTTTAASGAGTGLKTLAIGAGAGFLAGSLLRQGGNAAPQSQQQSQTPTQTSQPQQNPNLYDYSNKNTYSSQKSDYSIRDSPGASIYGSQAASPSLGTTFTPQQYAPAGQYLDQQGSQAQSVGQDFLIPAAIIAAAFIFSKN